MLDVTTEFQVAVFPGDGIGLEVMDACLAVLEALEQKTGGYRLRTEILPGGAAHYRDTGTGLPEENFRNAEAADAILFGAMACPTCAIPTAPRSRRIWRCAGASGCSPGYAR